MCKLNYFDSIYYHRIYNKICDAPYGEIPLTHKSEEDKLKFENHVKHWISCNEFRVFGFYIEFSNEYDKILKKNIYSDVEYTSEEMVVPKINKTEVARRCKEILKNTAVGTKLESGQIFNFLLTVLQGHYRWDLKAGCGVSAIGIQNSYFGSKCFNIHRTDGSVTDISYRQAISGKPPTDRQNVIFALRHAISPVIRAFYKTIDFSTSVCFISGEKITPENCEVHHYDKEFNELASAFIKKNGLENLVSKINDQEKDNTTEVYFTDGDIITEFILYHNSNTHLAVVTRQANQLAEKERSKK